MHVYSKPGKLSWSHLIYCRTNYSLANFQRDFDGINWHPPVDIAIRHFQHTFYTKGAHLGHTWL